MSSTTLIPIVNIEIVKGLSERVSVHSGRRTCSDKGGGVIKVLFSSLLKDDCRTPRDIAERRGHSVHDI